MLTRPRHTGPRDPELNLEGFSLTLVKMIVDPDRDPQLRNAIKVAQASYAGGAMKHLGRLVTGSSTHADARQDAGLAALRRLDISQGDPVTRLDAIRTLIGVGDWKTTSFNTYLIVALVKALPGEFMPVTAETVASNGQRYSKAVRDALDRAIENHQIMSRNKQHEQRKERLASGMVSLDERRDRLEEEQLAEWYARVSLHTVESVAREAALRQEGPWAIHVKPLPDGRNDLTWYDPFGHPVSLPRSPDVGPLSGVSGAASSSSSGPATGVYRLGAYAARCVEDLLGKMPVSFLEKQDSAWWIRKNAAEGWDVARVDMSGNVSDVTAADAPDVHAFLQGKTHLTEDDQRLLKCQLMRVPPPRVDEVRSSLAEMILSRQFGDALVIAPGLGMIPPLRRHEGYHYLVWDTRPDGSAGSWRLYCLQSGEFQPVDIAHWPLFLAALRKYAAVLPQDLTTVMREEIILAFKETKLMQKKQVASKELPTAPFDVDRRKLFTSVSLLFAPPPPRPPLPTPGKLSLDDFANIAALYEDRKPSGLEPA